MGFSSRPGAGKLQPSIVTASWTAEAGMAAIGKRHVRRTGLVLCGMRHANDVPIGLRLRAERSGRATGECERCEQRRCDNDT